MAENARKIGTVCVYCGAKAGKNPIFGEKAAGECALPASKCALRQVRRATGKPVPSSP